jgi:poly-gamma-glutamate synthesis protein (capsule biosynthesis protein)
MAQALEPFVTPRTLIIQSTDFSHYLPLDQAVQHDQQTLNALASADMHAVAQLRQPQHLDSKGAQYIHMLLQERRWRARPIVVENRNSVQYGATATDNTTSYIVQLYTTDHSDRVFFARAAHREQTWCFAGDTLFGRYVARWFERKPERFDRVRKALAERLQGCRLVLNLEGVLTDSEFSGRMPDHKRLTMPIADTLDWLRVLNVHAVSVANNHSRDMGDKAFAAMVERLRAAGIEVLEHGKLGVLPGMQVGALRDMQNRPRFRSELITSKDIESIRIQAQGRPWAAFMHWGREFEPQPGSRDLQLSIAIQRAGAKLIIGAHPHRASTELIGLAGGHALLAYSLGNFIFDQRGPKVSGCVLQITLFEQGTFWARLVPIPSVFELGSEAE